MVLPDAAGDLGGTTIKACDGCEFAAHVASLKQLKTDLDMVGEAKLYSTTLVEEHQVSVFARPGKKATVQLCICGCRIDYQWRR